MLGEVIPRVGLTVARQRINLRAINPAVVPAVLLLDGGRAIVLVEQLDPELFVAHDPATQGLVRVATRDIASALKCDVLCVRPVPADLRSAPGTEQAARGAAWFWRPLAKTA